ncbi:MAG: hypothetical protein AAFY60_16635, partial [Myxococcota bacterium]
IVAHRLSTIASVDRIVTLRKGRVQEVGTPAELAVSGVANSSESAEATRCRSGLGSTISTSTPGIRRASRAIRQPTTPAPRT